MGIAPACEITNEGVTIRFLGCPKKILFRDIRSIQKLSYLRAYLELFNLSKPAMWGFWNMSLLGVVLIETADKRRWAVSPENRDEFIQQVSSHLRNSD